MIDRRAATLADRWKPLQFFGRLLCFVAFMPCPATAAEPARKVIAQAVLEKDAGKKAALIKSLAGDASPDVPKLLTAWREDGIFIYQPEGQPKVVITLGEEKDADEKQAVFRLDTGEPLKDAAGKPLRLAASDLTSAEHDNELRAVMRSVLDLQALAERDLAKRIQAIQGIGFSQAAAKLPALLERQKIERDGAARLALREAIALIQVTDENVASKLAALRELRTLHTLSSYDIVKAVKAKATNAEVSKAAAAALAAIDAHRSAVNFFGTCFRGISLGSILLVVALGLAITFGLMGVINMAHGEMIAVGAYTTYVVQNIFGTGLALSPFGKSIWLPGINAGGWLYDGYFVAALPLSFLTAALVGIALERGIIQFLYRRPLESLLATWGVSLVLQQLFRLVFGANNVQVYSPRYLSGNWTLNDIIFAWNRVFVICFVIFIVFGIWLLLNKTPLGLLMRAVMQNRGMAACMGVRTERVNMLTFGLGSGLAGLAGAFLSQIGNVGPSLGQSYIVDSFMVVVVGGVGNIAGTVISAFGIGGIDQIFQQYLPAWVVNLGSIPHIGNFLQNLGQDSAVFGKILVLVGIILFLQWRPAGIFVARSRSLEG
jgi:urea transport system permease protein